MVCTTIIKSAPSALTRGDTHLQRKKKTTTKSAVGSTVCGSDQVRQRALPDGLALPHPNYCTLLLNANIKATRALLRFGLIDPSNHWTALYRSDASRGLAFSGTSPTSTPEEQPTVQCLHFFVRNYCTTVCHDETTCRVMPDPDEKCGLTWWRRPHD